MGAVLLAVSLYALALSAWVLLAARAERERVQRLEHRLTEAEAARDRHLRDALKRSLRG